MSNNAYNTRSKKSDDVLTADDAGDDTNLRDMISKLSNEVEL